MRGKTPPILVRTAIRPNMIRAFSYPLYPTRAQEAVLTYWLAQCCALYNAALEGRREAWRKQRVSISGYRQQKELTELRASDAEWRDIPVQIELSPLVRLDLAFKSFFRRCKRGEKPGFPRFRSSQRYDSFNIPYGDRACRIDGDRVSLPKLKMIKFHKYREIRGEVRRVIVSRTTRGWSVSFVCDLGAAPSKITIKSAVGVDMGLESFATLSLGERVANQRFLRAGQDALARRQRSYSRKCRGSSSKARAKKLVALAYEHVRNQRLDFARKLAAVLFARFDLIVHEDLTISRMVRGNLAKSIYDAAWGQFLWALACKAESAGKWCVPVDPRGTSQTCPRCGTVAKKALSQREHRCDCGFSAHRDHAAAQVILARGLRVGQLTEAHLEQSLVRSICL